MFTINVIWFWGQIKRGNSRLGQKFGARYWLKLYCCYGFDISEVWWRVELFCKMINMYLHYIEFLDIEWYRLLTVNWGRTKKYFLCVLVRPNKSILLQVMAWHRTGDESVPEPMLTKSAVEADNSTFFPTDREHTTTNSENTLQVVKKNK